MISSTAPDAHLTLSALPIGIFWKKYRFLGIELFNNKMWCMSFIVSVHIYELNIMCGACRDNMVNFRRSLQNIAWASGVFF